MKKKKNQKPEAPAEVKGKRKRKMSKKRRMIFLVSIPVLLLLFLYIQHAIVYLFFTPVKLGKTSTLLEMIMQCITERPVVFAIILIISTGLSYLMSGKLADDMSERYGDIRLSKERTKGESERMGGREKSELFDLRDYYNPDGIILARDKETGEAITLPWQHPNPDVAPSNGNILVLGDTGSRKTSGVLIQNIFSCIQKGCTIVLTDPKGELYGETIAAAKAYGYKTYILNIIGNHFQYSDGIDILKPVREAVEPEEVVNIIVNQIVKNVGSYDENFWNDMNTDLLRLIILTVAIGEGYIPKTSMDNAAKGRTFREAMELLADEELDKTIARLLTNDHNRKYLGDKFNTWSKHRERDSIRAGLSSKLGGLKSENLLRILSEDEIDFRRLNDEKSILYINASDKDDTYKAVLSLVSAMLFREVMEYADERSSKRLERPFYAFFEEFKNVGYIPDLAIKIAVTRSRNINMVFCFQNIAQIVDQYSVKRDGKNEWVTIMSSCATQVCCGANDEKTLEYFSNRSGDMSVIEEQTGREVSSIVPRFLKWNARENRRTGIGTRKVFLPSEIKNMPVTDILISPAKHNSTIEKKYFYKNHPLYQYKAVDKNGNIIFPSPDDHIPQWRKRDIQKDALRATGQQIEVKEDEIIIKKFEGLHKETGKTEKKSRSEIISQSLSNFKQSMYEEEETEEKKLPSARANLAALSLKEAAYKTQVIEITESSEVKEELKQETIAPSEASIYDDYYDDGLF